VQPKAFFFGAIGTLVDTSDMQRRAFNQAFEEFGLDWHWGAEKYAELLAIIGGRNRVASFAEAKGVEVDAQAVHAAKSRIYQDMLSQEGVTLRPGVADLIAHARASEAKLAWVTTTSRKNIDAILQAANGLLAEDMFSLITDREMVEQGKPDPQCYVIALESLSLMPSDAIAVEDTPDSLAAATRAGIPTVAFPGSTAPDPDWTGAVRQVNDLRMLLQ
jgi:HAD superfamily hydrolase (TIGR01509 family)